MASTVILIIVGAILAALLGLWIFGERGRLMRPSTWEVIREGGWRSLLNLNFLHFYIYARWTNQYIDTLVNQRIKIPNIKVGSGKDIGRWYADHYHGKVLPTELAKTLITVDQDIPRRDLEQIIPYPAARDLVLHSPPDIVVYECGCRHARENPCLPTQVCMVIGQPFTGFVLEHNPHTSRRITQAEALELLQAEHERGHVHAAYFKDACLDRFYAICNCCKCCCGGIQGMRTNTPMIAASGYVAQVDYGECVACDSCMDFCPFGALTADGGPTINWEECMGCGACVALCPSGAISLVCDEGKGVPLDVRALLDGRHTPQPEPGETVPVTAEEPAVAPK